MAFWLMKSEPDVFGWPDLKKKPVEPSVPNWEEEALELREAVVTPPQAPPQAEAGQPPAEPEPTPAPAPQAGPRTRACE